MVCPTSTELITLAERIRNFTPFQPISSESGLRPAYILPSLMSSALFNPYPAKADCDISTKAGRFACSALFNPYPAKADCDSVLIRGNFFLFVLFNPYPAKADCDSSTLCVMR